MIDFWVVMFLLGVALCITIIFGNANRKKKKHHYYVCYLWQNNSEQFLHGECYQWGWFIFKSGFEIEIDTDIELVKEVYLKKHPGEKIHIVNICKL